MSKKRRGHHSKSELGQSTEEEWEVGRRRWWCYKLRTRTDGRTDKREGVRGGWSVGAETEECVLYKYKYAQRTVGGVTQSATGENHEGTTITK